MMLFFFRPYWRPPVQTIEEPKPKRVKKKKRKQHIAPEMPHQENLDILMKRLAVMRERLRREDEEILLLDLMMQEAI